MRVLSVIHYPVFGGPHNRNMRLGPVLRDRGIETFVLLPQEGELAAEKIESAGVPVLRMPLHRMRATFNPMPMGRFFFLMLPEIVAIRKLLVKLKIDIVLINGLVNPHAAFSAYLHNLPVVWQILDTRPPMLLRRLMMPIVKKLADVVMCTGAEVARMHPGTVQMGERLVTFFPPVDTRMFQPNQNERLAARSRLGVPKDAFLIGSVGNINPQKGHEYLIRAFSILYNNYKNVFLRILGNFTPTHANYMKKLQTEIRVNQLGAKQRASIVNPDSSIATLLPAFDVFCLTSVPNSEGIPTVILEAMASGIPVIATNVGSIKEVVKDGVTGLLVPPLSPESVAKAVVSLIQNRGLLKNMGKEARRHAVERYEIEVCANAHIRAFELALEHKHMRAMRA